MKVLSRGDDVEYLRKLVESQRSQMQNADRYQKIRVLLADSPSTDARSFPGGTLIFYRGMLEFADNEAALVGVVGHELSHLDRGHQLDQLRRIKLAQQTFQGGQVAPETFFRNGALMMKMFTRPFRPEDEAEADLDAFNWSYRTGYDPRELARLFQRMHERDRERDARPAFFRTHPYHLDRFRVGMDRYAELQVESPAESLYLGRDNLDLRVPMSERRFEER